MRGSQKELRTALWSGGGVQIDFFDENGYGAILTFNVGEISLIKVTASGSETVRTWT